MSSFYGDGIPITSLDKEYIASFYMPIFTEKNQVLMIKNYSKQFVSSFVNDDGVLQLDTTGTEGGS